MSSKERPDSQLDEWQRKIVGCINSLPEKKKPKKSDSFFKSELDEVIENFNHDVSFDSKKMSAFKELDNFMKTECTVKEGDVLEINK